MEIVERLKQQLIADKGNSPEEAEVNAVQYLRNAGLIHPDRLELTPLGEARNSMTPEQRAISRRAKETGRSPHDYEYNSETNRATLKPHARASRNKNKRHRRY